MLDAIGLSKTYGAQRLLAGASFRISPGEKLALLGPNGSGKTTILRMLAGEEAPDGGEIRRPRRLEMGYMPQELDVVSELPLLTYVEDVVEDVQNIEAEVRDIENRMAGGETGRELLERYGHLRARYEHLGGYQLRARVQRILSGLGFREADWGKPIPTFSGGWRTRAALARILLREPDVILLDEPTNHLDILSLEWLEEYVQDSASAYVIVSHDVAFLDRVVRGVLALENGGVVRTQGNYSRYEQERALRAQQALAAHGAHQKRLAATKAFAERFRYKATKARQVQSRIRQMEKEMPPPAPPPRPETLALQLPQPGRTGRSVVRLESVDAGYGDALIYRGLDFRLDRGDKVVLIGPNGAGKSTLLKLLAGVLSPSAGRIEYGHKVRVSYFAQHQLDQLVAQRTVLEEMQSLPGLRSELEHRSVLGAFLFSGDAVDKRVGILSGGEKSRLVLAKIMADPGNFLLLDEPTNHLDIQACAVLKQALERFAGALCLITHDRDLINRVANRVAYVENGHVREYLGNYEDFVRKRSEETERPAPSPSCHQGADPQAPAMSRRERRRLEAERRERHRRHIAPLRSEVERLELRIAAAEERMREVEAGLADPAVYSDPPRAAVCAKERAALGRELEELGEAWEAAATRLEEREEELEASQAASRRCDS